VIKCALTSEDASLFTIEDEQLPYNRLVSLATPSLHLQLYSLSLTIDFLQVLSGCLSITQADDELVSSQGYHIIDVENIPTTAELRIDCSPSLNELKFQLQAPRRRPVCVSFVWDEGLHR
jgi:hypothetical protein